MLKLTIMVLAVALAGTASAAGWRNLRVDGSSEEAFAQSLEVFKDKLSPKRTYAFGEALKDIWIQGAKAAEAEQREYTADEYYRQVDGLRYEEVVTYTDPTGDTAKYRYRLAGQRQSFAGKAPATRASAAETQRRQRDASAEYWTLFGGGGDGPPRGSPSLSGIPGQQ
jgi:hypothetical protein